MTARMSLVLQNLGLRNQGAILNLLRGSDQLGCSAADVIEPGSDDIGHGLSPALPAVRWMAGIYFAEELTSFIRACDGSLEGQLETTLFVDAKWRRQGIGTLLLKATMDWAALRQASTLRFVCPRTNWPMRHFAEKFGARLDLVLGQIIADIPLGGRIDERQGPQTPTEIQRK